MPAGYSLAYIIVRSGILEGVCHGLHRVGDFTSRYRREGEGVSSHSSLRPNRKILSSAFEFSFVGSEVNRRIPF